MGAGRKTETVHVHTGNSPSTGAPYGLNTSTSHRNLSKGNLGGVIFGCKNSTMKDCLSKQLFGLPYGHFAYVKNIQPGLPLFLFNYSDRKLHGIFEAASPGILNIDPYGWTDGSDRTPYPAQVQVRVRLHCQPLSEDQFKPIISDNYYTANHFWFELDHAQTSKLISLLASLAIASSSSIPQQSVRRRNISAVLPPREFREGVEKLMVMPADPENINQFSGISDYLDDFPPLGEDNQSLDSHWQMKLKDIALNQEHQDLHSEDESEDAPSLENVSLEAPNSLKEKNEEKLQSSLDYPAIIDKLIQELGELKAYSIEQTSKLSHLEEKLAKAETEIQRQKDRCSKLESMIDPSSQSTLESTIEPINEQHLDIRESIFLLGGYDSLSWLSTMDSYFPSHNVIKSLKPMNSVRSYASVAKLNEELYVFGGGDGHSWYETVDCYSVAENTWTSKPSLNLSRGSLGGAVLNDNIFALGGGNGLDCFSEVEMLDLDIGKWIFTRSMLQKRFALAAVELNGMIYATGGYDGNSYLNSAERFDPREYSWTRIPSMNSRRGCHSLVVLNEKLYALGGFDGTAMVPSVEIFDPRLGSWIVGEPMNCSRGYSAAADLDGSIYVIGGVRADESIADTVECYKEGQGWREIVSTAVGKRCFLSAIVL
ncbi:kelch-like protein 5 isoform X2 [Punica granatum]|uniref:Kelch-like protein 5 isoform X2 n=1 Tax=Punica granatum TaxID=22663 RepID=A0A6P8C4J2_PUNGR|nr:kelch-like protein 5 isoform X2 [Punica granatum]